MRRLTAERLFALALFLAAAAAAVSINVFMLGRTSATDQPVGKLSPAVHLPAAPHWTVRPRTTRVRDEGADD